MKLKQIFRGVFALLLIATSLSANIVFAADQTIESVPKDCQLITSAGTTNADGTTTINPNTLPDSFAVGRCLSTSGQKNSNFLPIGKTKSDGSAAVQATSAPDGTEKSARIVLVAAIDTLVKIVATVSLIVFIIGALITIVSGGKDELIDRGKTAMIYSVIGLSVSLLSFIIVTFVQSLFFVS